MYYYRVSLLNSSAPELTYSSTEDIEQYSIVTVPLKSKTKEALVLEVVEKPSFDTQDICDVTNRYYKTKQIEVAKFISQYYFSSFSEAISLFMPFSSEDIEECVEEQVLNKPTLSTAQIKAFESIKKENISLLFGVTGSGKTEIFIELIYEMIKVKKQSIFLMPEISLTPQMEKRLQKYFGSRVAMWHSKLTKKKKLQILQDIKSGKVQIVAGARSALFVPFDNLGLIVVDEEHDDSYKAMTRPRYHARDVAVLLGKKFGAKVLLASATPSVSSYKKYKVVKLDKPFIESKKSFQFIGGDSVNQEIVNAIRDNFHNNNQSLMFVPTRGNFKYLYCESCGKTHLCPYCSVGMALHRQNRLLKCHYCNFTESIKDSCTYCGHIPLKSERVGTVEVKEIVSGSIDGIVVEQFDRDSISTQKKLKDALKRFENKESQLLLGTQMLSKGHDYADITLSVIMGLDYILGLADYRARERAMSLFMQIAGRSGRAHEAKVLIQSNEEDFFKSYLDDYETFIKDELAFLEVAEYPPFISLARVLVASKDESKASKITLDTVGKLKEFNNIEIVGHGKAPVEKIANKFRFNILLKSKSRVELLKALHSVDCRDIEIDFDPVEFS